MTQGLSRTLGQRMSLVQRFGQGRGLVAQNMDGMKTVGREIDYLLQAAGGSSGTSVPETLGAGGGGGAGQLKYGRIRLSVGTPIVVRVGQPGGGPGANGGDSVIGPLVALGGGGGGSNESPGKNGGNGGGGSNGTGTIPGGVGSDHDGGAGSGSTPGGGGGTAANGTTGDFGGGAGTTHSIGGSPQVYGAGGSWGQGTSPAPGSGGGNNGENGRKGVVIFSYLTKAMLAVGGVRTTNEDRTIHTFDSDGTFVILA